MENSPDLILIQATSIHSSNLPLFLIHGDDGDISKYFLLNPLDRNVYGIRNRCCDSAKAWPGGIPEMAKAYLDLIRAVKPRGEILLGGWSLGGLISLEIALIIARNELSPLNVEGIIMIHTMFPSYQLRIEQVSKRPDSNANSHNGVGPCMIHNQRMIATWRPSPWPVRYIYTGLSDFESESPIVPQEPERISEIRYRQPPPPTILLRARHPASLVARCNNAGYCADTHCHRPMLGWESYKEDFIVSIIDIEGNCFSIFDNDYLIPLHRYLDQSCRLFD